MDGDADRVGRVTPPGAFPLDLRPVERLGGGALGETWRAVRRPAPGTRGESSAAERLPRVVALKLVPGAGAPRAVAAGRSLVHRERHLRGRISRLLFVGVASGDLVLGSDFVEGEALGGFRRRQGLTVGEALSLLQQAAEALGELAAVGLFHGDLKPTSLVRAGTGWWLTDAAVAALLHQLAGHPNGPFLGTPPYGAPELARGGALGVAADVYSLGVLVGDAWEPTGREAWAGAPDTRPDGGWFRAGRLFRWGATPSRPSSVGRGHEGGGMPPPATASGGRGVGGRPRGHDRAGRLGARRFARREPGAVPGGLEASVADLLRRMTAADVRRRPSPEEIRREATDLLAQLALFGRVAVDDGASSRGPVVTRSGRPGACGGGLGLARSEARSETRADNGGPVTSWPTATTDDVGSEVATGAAGGGSGPAGGSGAGGTPGQGGTRRKESRPPIESAPASHRRAGRARGGAGQAGPWTGAPRTGPPGFDLPPGPRPSEPGAGAKDPRPPEAEVAGTDLPPGRSPSGASSLGENGALVCSPERVAHPTPVPTSSTSDGHRPGSRHGAFGAAAGRRRDRRPDAPLCRTRALEGVPAREATSAERGRILRSGLPLALAIAIGVLFCGWLALGRPLPALPSASTPRSASAARDGRPVEVRGSGLPEGSFRMGAGAADVGVLGASGPPPVAPGVLCAGPEAPIETRATVLYADVSGEGCLSRAVWARGEVEVVLRPGGRLRRFRLGRAGDVLFLGRFTCTPRATLGLYRPRTGQLFLFGAWPRPGEAVAPIAAWATGRRDGRVVVMAEGRCQTVEVESNRKH